MNKRAIIEEISKDTSHLEYCKRICARGDLYKDLHQHVLLILLETNEEVLIDVYSRGKLGNYMQGIAYKELYGANPRFRNQYEDRACVDELRPVRDEPEDEFDVDNMYREVINLMSKIEKKIAIKRYPTELRLLELYAKHGTFRRVADEVGISFKTAQYLVKQITEKIRKEYDISCNG